MVHRRITRTVAVMASMALVFAAFTAAPAEAKKKKKKKRPAVCAAYQPGDLGKGAETTVITDAATEEAPVELTVPTEAGVGFTSSEPNGGEGAPSFVRHNVQVDTAAKASGLFVKLEFAPTWDYDLFLRTADGTAVAYSAGFLNHSSGEGGHSDIGYEQIDGAVSADCQGYTVDIGSAVTPGGDVTLKLWLGEPAA